MAPRCPCRRPWLCSETWAFPLGAELRGGCRGPGRGRLGRDRPSSCEWRARGFIVVPGTCPGAPGYASCGRGYGVLQANAALLLCFEELPLLLACLELRWLRGLWYVCTVTEPGPQWMEKLVSQHHSWGGGFGAMPGAELTRLSWQPMILLHAHELTPCPHPPHLCSPRG